MRFAICAFALCVPLAQGTVWADENSRSIVDVRFDGPYRQVTSSMGDQWAPTWGRNDVLYTGNDDGNSFGGVSSNTIGFGKLVGSDPNSLTGIAINGMQAFKELQLGPEFSNWQSLDSFRIKEAFYRFSACGAADDNAICLSRSSDGGKTWVLGKAVFRELKLAVPRFIAWSQRSEAGLSAKPGEYVYAAAYAGVIEGEDQYFIARAPLASWPELATADWSFRQADYTTWGALKDAAPMSRMSLHGKIGPDGANWKTTNTYSVDGVLYMFVTRCTYPSNSNDAQRRHVWQNSSLIKSTDEGLTWRRSPQENYARPMFAGQRFGTPYFVWYEKDGEAHVDNAGQYIYAVSNNGHFENGDDYVLGRVLRSRLPRLSADDWSFYTKGNGLEDRSWTPKLDEARAILSQPGRSSMTGMTYVPGLRRYVMVTWYYHQANFEAGIAAKDLSTVIEFFEAPKPWGPWTKVKSYPTGKLGWYTPIIGQRFQTAAGSTAVKAFLYLTGSFTKPDGRVDLSLYKFTYLPITLSTKPLKHMDPLYVGGR